LGSLFFTLSWLYQNNLANVRLDLDVRNILTHIPRNSNVFTTNLAIGDGEGAIPIDFLIFHLTLNKVGQQTVFVATTMALSAQ